MAVHRVIRLMNVKLLMPILGWLFSQFPFWMFLPVATLACLKKIRLLSKKYLEGSREAQVSKFLNNVWYRLP